jgi:ribosomal protein S18 acetylase RimI-like enzyme
MIANLQHPPPHFTTLVAERGFDVVGFVTVAPYRTNLRADSADPAAGAEVWAIYVLPELWGRGIGRALMTAGLDLLVEADLGPARLWTLEDNEIGRRFYERYGFALDGETSELTIGEQRLKVVRYSIDGPPPGS